VGARCCRAGPEESQARVRDGEVPGPGPVGGEPQDEAPGRADEAGGDVQQAIAEGLGRGLGQLALEEVGAAPGQQVGGGEAELEPRLIGGESQERHAVRPGALQGLDAVLGLGVAAVAGFELDGVAGLVREHHLVAPAVGIVNVRGKGR
jgi:hypothetical protein